MLAKDRKELSAELYDTLVNLSSFDQKWDGAEARVIVDKLIERRLLRIVGRTLQFDWDGFYAVLEDELWLQDDLSSKVRQEAIGFVMGLITGLCLPSETTANAIKRIAERRRGSG